jgi:hypothetical protein
MALEKDADLLANKKSPWSSPPPPYYTDVASVPEDDKGNEETVVYENEDDDVADAEKCGIGCFKPDFLQPLKNMKVFLLVFILAGISQGM